VFFVQNTLYTGQSFAITDDFAFVLCLIQHHRFWRGWAQVVSRKKPQRGTEASPSFRATGEARKAAAKGWKAESGVGFLGREQAASFPPPIAGGVRGRALVTKRFSYSLEVPNCLSCSELVGVQVWEAMAPCPPPHVSPLTLTTGHHMTWKY